MVLSLLFIICYLFCYQASVDSGIFNGLIALTVYRMSWNMVKLISAIPVGPDAAWTDGSPFQSIMSYLLYLTMCIGCCKVYRRFVKRPVSFPVRSLLGLFAVILLCQMLLEFTYQFLYSGSVQTGVLFFLTALLYCVVNFILCVVGASLTLLQEENLSMQNFIRSKQQYYEKIGRASCRERVLTSV